MAQENNQSKTLRAMVGKRVRIRRDEHDFIGLLLGKLDTWKTARPDLVTQDNEGILLWCAVNGMNGEFYFPADKGFNVTLAPAA